MMRGDRDKRERLIIERKDDWLERENAEMGGQD